MGGRVSGNYDTTVLRVKRHSSWFALGDDGRIYGYVYMFVCGFDSLVVTGSHAMSRTLNFLQLLQQIRFTINFLQLS